METNDLAVIAALWLPILATLIMRRKNAKSEETRNGRLYAAILIVAAVLVILATIKAFGPPAVGDFLAAALPWILLGLGVAFAAALLLNRKK